MSKSNFRREAWEKKAIPGAMLTLVAFLSRCIYEYILLNLTYSSNRMASNRLTRNEVEQIYRTNKITTRLEPAKVDDIIETINHFAAVRFVIDNITELLTGVPIRKLHHLLPTLIAKKRSDLENTVFPKRISACLQKRSPLRFYTDG